MSHNILPWDDDVDLMVKYEDYANVKKIYNNQSFLDVFSVFGYHDKSNEWSQTGLGKVQRDRTNEYNKNTKKFRLNYHKHKLYFHGENRIEGVPWRWPFIDIKFYKQNSTFVWKHDYANNNPNIPIKDFYPLIHRPFATLWLPAPYHTAAILHNKYGKFKCGGTNWNHSREKSIPVANRVYLNCSDLINGVYIYIERLPFKESTLELAWDHDHTKYGAIVNAPCEKRGALQI